MAFEQGQSGNPAGRPRGIRDRRTELRGMLLESAPELIAKVVAMARAGDTTALRICMDRLLPPAKAKDDPVPLDGITDSLTANSRRIVRAMSEGHITPEEASTMLGALASQARIVEADEIEKRLAALEQAAAMRKR